MKSKIKISNWFEPMIWIAGLFYLAFIANFGSNHFTICPISNLGFDFCPGCGLGHSISMIFSGNIFESFFVHPLGIFALIIITYRIVSVSVFNINYSKNINLTERKNHA